LAKIHYRSAIHVRHTAGSTAARTGREISRA